MDRELLEIIPRELKFTFELKKQSSCSVQLVNISDHYVAFKVKTTSPKKYCVRPNTGIIHPKSTCDFTVAMQAQRVAPPDMQCKDKFLIQGTVVPYGTAEEAVTPAMFAKDTGKYIEENKLKVILLSPPQSPQSPVLLPMNGVLRENDEASNLRDQLLSGVKNLSPVHKVANDEHLKPSKDAEELKPIKDAVVMKQTKDVEFKLAEDVEELKPAIAKTVEEFKQTNNVELKLSEEVEELKVSKDVEELKSAKSVEELKADKNKEELKSAKNMEELDLAKDVEDMKLKLKELEAKLSGAETTITMLRQERSTTIVERQTLQQQLAMLRRKNGVKRDRVGFPFLFVCMVALIGMALGYLIRY